MKKFLFLILMFSLMINVQYLFSKGIIINHNHTDITTITQEQVNKVLKNIRVGYQHTSHGSQLTSGMLALAEYNKMFSVPYSTNGFVYDVFFNDYAMPETPDLGTKGNIAFANTTIKEMGNKSNNRNVIMWSWCGGVSTNDLVGINKYLEAMSDLEQKFPNVYFVYMTGHLDGTGKDGNLNKMNDIIRQYCIDNDKILFDFADIESYAPGIDKNLMELNANDNCDFDANGDNTLESNWAKLWLIANPNNELTKIANSCKTCAHSQLLNCALKGIATWNLFIQISDKIETNSSIEESNSAESDDIKIYPNPSNSIFNLSINANIGASITVDLFDARGNLVKQLIPNSVQKHNNASYSFDISNLPVGTYELRAVINGKHLVESFIKN